MRRIALPTFALILAASLIGSPSIVTAADTIVGTWAPDPRACRPVDGMLSIGPLSLTADMLSCTFATVSRTGNVITWRGRCSSGEAAPKPSLVTAMLRGGTLSIVIDGSPIGTVHRCRPQ